MGKLEKNNLNKSISGFVKVWKSSPDTGESELIVDQPNLILYGGAGIMAHALGGDPNYKIWGMYIGYNNNANFTRPVIDVDYSQPFNALSSEDGFGYLREPLTFPATYLSDLSYEDNTALFSVMISSATAAGGAEFISGTSNIYEVGLVCAPDLSNSTRDIVFSRTGFNQVRYDSNFNFTITWGIKFLVD